MNFEYTKSAARSFDAVVDDIGKLAVEKSFRVLHIHDVQATLAEKGFAREPLKIVEICNSKFANEALKKNIGVSLFMPCKINVYLEHGRTMIKAMRPAAIAEFYPGVGLEALAAEIDKVIIEIVDKAASGK